MAFAIGLGGGGDPIRKKVYCFAIYRFTFGRFRRRATLLVRVPLDCYQSNERAKVIP